MNKRLAIILFILISLIPSLGMAALFSPKAMKDCAQIAIIPGTYDPFSKGHERLGRRILSDLKFDCVLFFPTQDPPHKVGANPFEPRYQMLKSVIHDDPNLFYPNKEDAMLSPKELVEKAKAANPKIKSYAVLGSDLSPHSYMKYINDFRLNPDGYIVSSRGDGEVVVHDAFKSKELHLLEIKEEDISSTMVRNWFLENQHLYFQKVVTDEELPNHLLDPKIARYILNNGVYYAQLKSDSNVVKTLYFKAFFWALDKLGIEQDYQSFKIKRFRQDKLTHVEIDGQIVKLNKHLHSSFSGDRYTVNYQGKSYIIKIANKNDASKQKVANSVYQHLWLEKKTRINIPKIIQSELEGQWVLMERIEGITLAKYLNQNDGVIEESIEKQLRVVVEEALHMSAIRNYKLNVSAHNLIISDGVVYLFDPASRGQKAIIPKNYDEFLKHWKGEANPKLKGIGNSCKNLIKSFFRI